MSIAILSSFFFVATLLDLYIYYLNRHYYSTGLDLTEIFRQIESGILPVPKNTDFPTTALVRFSLCSGIGLVILLFLYSGYNTLAGLSLLSISLLTTLSLYINTAVYLYHNDKDNNIDDNTDD